MRTKDKTYIYISKESGKIEIQGITPDILTLYAIITENMYKLKGVDKEDIDLAFRLATMTDEEKQKELDKKLEKLLKEFEKKLKESEK